MEWLYNLSTPARITFVLILAALVGGIIWFAYDSNDVVQPDDEEGVGVIDTPAQPSPDPSETEDSPDSDEPTEEPDSETPEGELEAVEPEVTSLSIEQEEEALSIANEGVVEWLTVDSRESLEDRQERLAPYISSESEMYNSAGRYRYPDSWEGGSVYALAEVGTLEPVGGTEADFRVLAGMTLQEQVMFTSDNEDEEPIGSITESYVVFEIALRLEEGGWRLFDYQEL